MSAVLQEPIEHDREWDGAPEAVCVSGERFVMGLTRHYPEEALANRETVVAFRIDRTPATDRKFKDFVNATGDITTARIAPSAGLFELMNELSDVHLKTLVKNPLVQGGISFDVENAAGPPAARGAVAS